MRTVAWREKSLLTCLTMSSALPCSLRGVLRYQPPRYMLIPQLITQLLAASHHHATPDSPPVLTADGTLAVALCRMGADDEFIASGTLGELLALAAPSVEEATREEEEDDADEMASEAELDKRRAARAEQRALKAFGLPLHSLVIVGNRLHELEVEYAGLWKVGEKWNKVASDILSTH